MNVGLVYDGSIRDNGTPFLYRLAMTKMLGSEPVWHTEAMPIKCKCDFHLHVDDGRDDLSVDGIPRPWAYYAIDTHLGLEARLRKASKADLVWVAQLPAVEEFAKHGIKAEWLPLACEPLVHTSPGEVDEAPDRKCWDLAFVGYMQDPKHSNRVAFLDAMFKAFPNSWLACGYFFRDMAKVYHLARIGLNHAVREDLNMRFFELASMGVPQLCDARMQGLKELGFVEYVHYIPYSSTEEAIGRARQSLRYQEDELIAMAINARALVRAHHTYEHRVETVLQKIKEHVC